MDKKSIITNFSYSQRGFKLFHLHRSSTSFQNLKCKLYFEVNNSKLVRYSVADSPTFFDEGGADPFGELQQRALCWLDFC